MFATRRVAQLGKILIVLSSLSSDSSLGKFVGAWGSDEYAFSVFKGG